MKTFLDLLLSLEGRLLVYRLHSRLDWVSLPRWVCDHIRHTLSLNVSLRAPISLSSRSRQWENEVLKRLLAVQPTLEHVHISFYLSQTLGEELDNNVYSVIPYMSVNYVLMATFCICVCLMKDWVRGKPVVVLAGLLGAAMATGTAFGILMYCGVPFIGINIAAPFLMLGECVKQLHCYRRREGGRPGRALVPAGKDRGSSWGGGWFRGSGLDPSNFRM